MPTSPASSPPRRCPAMQKCLKRAGWSRRRRRPVRGQRGLRRGRHDRRARPRHRPRQAQRQRRRLRARPPDRRLAARGSWPPCCQRPGSPRRQDAASPPSASAAAKPRRWRWSWSKASPMPALLAHRLGWARSLAMLGLVLRPWHGLGAQLGHVGAVGRAPCRRRVALPPAMLILMPPGMLHVAGLHVGRAGAVPGRLDGHLVRAVGLRHRRAGGHRIDLHLVVRAEVAGGRAVRGDRAALAHLADRVEVPAAAQVRRDRSARSQFDLPRLAAPHLHLLVEVASRHI